MFLIVLSSINIDIYYCQEIFLNIYSTFNLPNGSNRSLWGNSRNKAISSGAPDITGTVTYGTGRWHNTGIIATTNAFKSSESSVTVSAYQVYDDEVGTNTNAAKITFKASDSSSIYGTTTYVRPQSIGIIFFIKY